MLIGQLHPAGVSQRNKGEIGTKAPALQFRATTANAHSQITTAIAACAIASSPRSPPCSISTRQFDVVYVLRSQQSKDAQ